MPRISKYINVTARCHTAFRTQELGRELCGEYHLYALAICRLPGRSQEELARDLHLHKSSVARAISHLESRGLVERRPDPSDGRVSRVYPTDRMLEMLPTIKELTNKWNSIISEGISEEEMAIFESVIERIAENAKNAVREVSLK